RTIAAITDSARPSMAQPSTVAAPASPSLIPTDALPSSAPANSPSTAALRTKPVLGQNLDARSALPIVATTGLLPRRLPHPLQHGRVDALALHLQHGELHSQVRDARSV